MDEKISMKMQIFLAAVELFGEHSYSRVSMRDIAAKIGIKASSIYNHYSSKEELLNDIFKYYLVKVAEIHNEAVDIISAEEHKPKVKDLYWVYPPEEAQIMYWITRIIYMEQFTSDVAAAAILGSFSHDGFSAVYSIFFNSLVEMGIIKNAENCPIYSEMLVRMSHSYQLAYIHPEHSQEMMDMYSMYCLLFKLILTYEGTIDRFNEIIDMNETKGAD